MILKLIKLIWKIRFLIPITIIYIISFYIARYLVKVFLDISKTQNFKIISLNAETSFFFIMLFALYLTFIFHIPILIKLFIKHKDMFYKREKKIIYWSFVTIPLGLMGSFFSYYVVIYMILPFFMGFNEFLGIERVIGFDKLIQLIVIQGLAFFLFFQIPLIMKLLITLKIFRKKHLKNKNIRFIYLILVLILSSWLTPPDPVSMLTVAIPLYLCYELGLFFSKDI